MSKIRILSAADVEKLFTVDMALAAVEDAYVQKSDGSGSVWPMVFHDFETGVADLDIKSGDLGAKQIFGLKLVSGSARTRPWGCPSSSAPCCSATAPPARRWPS